MGKIKNLVAGLALPVQKQQLALRLDAELTELAAEVGILNLENQKLRAEVNPLKLAIEKCKEKVAHLEAAPKLTFNQCTGTYADASGIHYCTKCECENGKRNPLKNDTNGWRCMACKTYYPDPSRPEPKPNVPLWKPRDPSMGY